MMTKDANYQKVTLLLHCNGDNGSSLFIDRSKYNASSLKTGTPEISTAEYLFNGSSLLLENGDSLAINGDRFNFALKDFTIELAIKSSQNTETFAGVLHGLSGGNGYWGIRTRHFGSNVLGFSINYNGNWYEFRHNTSVNDGIWHRIAVVRKAGVFYLFLDGALLATQSGWETIPVGTINTGVSIGYEQTDNSYYIGNIAEIRVTNYARYASNYVVDATPFPNTGLSIAVTLQENIAATDFVVNAYRLSDGMLDSSAIMQSSEELYIDLVDPVLIMVIPVQGDVWKASTYYAANDLVFPKNPTVTPYYYKRLMAGSSGATEPTWATTAGGKCSDNGVTNAWECVARLTQPITQGPLVPS